MPKAVVTDGYTLDEYIPLYLRDFFYKSSYPEYIYNTTDGKGSYDFSTNGLVLYLPLFALKDSPFKSVDAYEHTCVVTDALWGPQGRDFNGSTATMIIPDHAALTDIFAGGGTICAWVYPDSDGESNVGRIYSRRGALGGCDLNVKEDNATGVNFAFRASFDVTDGTWDTNTNPILLAAWNFVTVTYNSDSKNNAPVFYLDTVLKTTITVQGADGDYETDSGENVGIGCSVTGTLSWEGLIGEVWLYNRALTASEVQHNYNTTAWRYR